ncbi:MAG: ABC transporter permease [bacterium]
MRKNENQEIKNTEIFVSDKEINEDIAILSQRQLMWMNFKKHKLAIIGVIALIIIYTLSIFAGFFSPYDPYAYDSAHQNHPPQRIRFFDENGFRLRPFVYSYDSGRDPSSFRLEHKINKEKKYPIYFFIKGSSYKLLGLFETNIRFFGTGEDGYVYLLGADENGRDMLSRILHGGRISTSIGFIGVALSFIIGIILGGISGYYGGIVDNVIQRGIELLRSIPRIPLWMGLSAAFPVYWSPVTVYFAITVILSLLGWTSLARQVRSKYISLKEEDFIMAAKLSGNKQFRILIHHMLPNFISHIIAAVTLAIPGMILGETALSFLGIGLRPPVVSWGVLLQTAQNIRTVDSAPWLLLPGVAVVITVLSFNFVGDGLRDAADPHGRRG